MPPFNSIRIGLSGQTWFASSPPLAPLPSAPPQPPNPPAAAAVPVVVLLPGPPGAPGAPGAPGTPGGPAAASLLLQWTGGAVVFNGTYYFLLYAPYGGSITALDGITGTGSFTATVEVDGVAVSGLAAVTVHSTAVTTMAGANSFNPGQTIQVVITGATGSPTDVGLNLRILKA